ncbi:uncharacterized protein Z518_11118 [Rhinocladiella mackenziei CBS 650.93]|uniref:AAA+ ATPase domain-containing protein n=1 Tax=Rhinocladiella mackenziei CBS 650.93 TaxID=1442369 RepID=A0A0D2I8Y1_9EURO|nr:uncharacterized protein Z518_11118 [Rhinocladiella mackenziei CBS 650.93]KIW99705.1 hypothetical protein Z518_11118 [Rhinocladiella mackenziei CBS 650.93]
MPVASKVMRQSKGVQASLPGPNNPDTPPDSPTTQLPNPFEFAKQFLDALKSIQTSEPKGTSSAAETNAQQSEPISRASKLEVKEVHEVWNPKAYEYKVVESPPAVELTELDTYVFVVRTRVERTSLKSTTYVDIKSEDLRDILRIVLKDIKWLSLGEDKPAIEQNLLFHYLSELEAYRVGVANGSIADRNSIDALDLLIHTIKNRYKATAERLNPLLKEGKITYDLLWALFKANDYIISICPGSGKPKCLRYEMGEEKKTEQGVKYFELHCQYLDFDGKVFGTVHAKLIIEKFGGARRINTLNAFPLEFHPNPKKMREHLAARGQKFINLVGIHHQSYRGQAFFQRKDDLIRKTISSRIIIDAEQFRKSIPSYPRFFTKSSDLDLHEDDWLLCSPTVMGFSLRDKFWGEYAVEDIRPIDWSDLPFATLTIPSHKKEVILAITQNRLGQPIQDKQPGRPTTFDDVVEGKGRGINILLHGPSGVGKTFAAEALSEHFHRPLYSISAGELSLNAAELEEQLDRIFRTAKAWNALLLMDVFLQERSRLSLDRNCLVAVFLRKLEFYDGVFFLTTNLLNDFDAAILNRIHLKLKYDDLDKGARKNIITQFLKAIDEGAGFPGISTEYMDRFACVPLNGRQVNDPSERGYHFNDDLQIRNTISTANDLANGKGERLSSSHISQALDTSGYVVPKLGDISMDDSLYE